MNDLVIYAADIGSVAKGRFGWWRRTTTSPSGHGGSRPDELVNVVADDLEHGRPVALGFECPLWMDLPRDASELTRARNGEGDRASSAGAGSGALATGLAQTAWILRELRPKAPTVRAFLDWHAFATAKSGLFIWEAFVTKEAKVDTHEGDATKATDAFGAALPNPVPKSSVTQRGPEVSSLIGAALLRTGWTTDISVLGQACLVIRARKWNVRLRGCAKTHPKKKAASWVMTPAPSRAGRLRDPGLVDPGLHVIPSECSPPHYGASRMRAVSAMAASAWRFRLAAFPTQIDSRRNVSTFLPLGTRVCRW